MIKQCPINPNFRFRTRCTIKNCRMYSERTANRCMELDTKFAGDKNISDKELTYYKKPELDLKSMTALRKKAVNRTYAVLALRSAVQHVTSNPKVEVTLSPELMPPNVRNIFNKALNSKIFKVPELALEPWMLTLLLDRKYAEGLPVNIHTFHLHLLFLLTTTEFKNLTEYFTRLGTTRNQRGLFNV